MRFFSLKKLKPPVDEVIFNDELDLDVIKNIFSVDGCVFINNAVREDIVESLYLLSEELSPLQNRVRLFNHKKGGSIGKDTIEKHTDFVRKIYESKKIIAFISTLSGKKLLTCPDSDAHAYALYFYDEEGDHIGWHYDTSLYKGERYTFLIGILDNSQCLLECVTKNKSKLQFKLGPGGVVLLDGNKVKHRVTPTKKNDSRVVLSLEYITDARISFVMRLLAKIKDFVFYFGWQTFKK